MGLDNTNFIWPINGLLFQSYLTIIEYDLYIGNNLSLLSFI